MKKVLDLFCGLGGWSKGFAKVGGFDITGVDVVDVGYPYRLILTDVRALNGRNFRNYEVIVGSPPCREFTQLPDVHWREKKNVKRGLELVGAFLRIVKEARPRIWLMENVPKLNRYMIENPRCTVRLSRGMRRCFWGNFPGFLIPRDCRKTLHEKESDKRLRSWKRAEIPLPVAESFARACKLSLFPWDLKFGEER